METIADPSCEAPDAEVPSPILRRKARLRSTFLTGSGFALYGFPKLALLGYFFVLILVLAILALAVLFTSWAAWLVLGSMGLVVAFGTMEYVVLGKLPIPRQASKNWVSKRFLLIFLLLDGAGLVGVLLFLVN